LKKRFKTFDIWIPITQNSRIKNDMDRKYENILDFKRKDVLLQSEKRKSKMAKKSKDQRIQVILECTEQKTSGVPGMSRYITMKNKKNTPERLELKKFNPYLKKVTVHKEIK
jgi:large subunit ribosomal protein L33